MPLFRFIKLDEIHLANKKKVIPAEEISMVIEASEIVEKTKKEEIEYRAAVAQECEKLKERAEQAGFEVGLKKWNEQLAWLEKEIKKVRQEMENSIVPLALTAVKKIIGKELETKPETIVDVVATGLKTVSHHRKITIYVNQNDLEYVETYKQKLKALFEHLETLSIAKREDVQPGGCIIETESGIINAQLENQLNALETAFRNFFQNKKK